MTNAIALRPARGPFITGMDRVLANSTHALMSAQAAADWIDWAPRVEHSCEVCGRAVANRLLCCSDEDYGICQDCCC